MKSLAKVIQVLSGASFTPSAVALEALPLTTTNTRETPRAFQGKAMSTRTLGSTTSTGGRELVRASDAALTELKESQKPASTAACTHASGAALCKFCNILAIKNTQTLHQIPAL